VSVRVGSWIGSGPAAKRSTNSHERTANELVATRRGIVDSIPLWKASWIETHGLSSSTLRDQSDLMRHLNNVDFYVAESVRHHATRAWHWGGLVSDGQRHRLRKM